MRLLDKAIVVTGSTGIAAEAARLFAHEGAHVHVIARNPETTSSLAESVEGSYSLADLRDEEETAAAFTIAIETLEGIDGLLGVAGGSGRKHGDGPLHEISLMAWDKTLEMNLNPVFLASREAVRAMRIRGVGGSIVLVSSVLARYPSTKHFSTHAYAAAKGAQLSLARSMAAQYASEGVRVNSIAPGLVETPMSARAAENPEIVSFTTNKQPLVGGLLTSTDIAHAAVYLLSDESRAVTGQELAVDGGWGLSETLE
jgi:NAD(P)-dependent dehydrogenase (short-subunit alcohol dehydrogenase family)